MKWCAALLRRAISANLTLNSKTARRNFNLSRTCQHFYFREADKQSKAVLHRNFAMLVAVSKLNNKPAHKQCNSSALKPAQAFCLPSITLALYRCCSGCGMRDRIVGFSVCSSFSLGRCHQVPPDHSARGEPDTHTQFDHCLTHARLVSLSSLSSSQVIHHLLDSFESLEAPSVDGSRRIDDCLHSS
jgi:hypothetical protein